MCIFSLDLTASFQEIEVSFLYPPPPEKNDKSMMTNNIVLLYSNMVNRNMSTDKMSSGVSEEI